MRLVPLELYVTLQPGCAATGEVARARARWLTLATASGLTPAWPSVVTTATAWGVHVRGLLWRPGLHRESIPPEG